MRVLVYINSSAGSVAAHCASGDAHSPAGQKPLVERIQNAFRDAGASAEVTCLPARELTEAVRQGLESNADVIVAGGGDGTLNLVANHLVGSGKAFGVLPLGTLNHFSKDLGLPSDMAEAARVIVAGRAKAVDVGEVNGRYFLNNSSIGLYPRIVKHRTKEQERLGRGKWLAMLSACINAFRRYPTVTVRLEMDGVAPEATNLATPSPTDVSSNHVAGPQTILRQTPFVFVGNNSYTLNLFSLGSRKSIDRGELCLYSTPHVGRFGLIKLAFLALFNRLVQARDFDAACLQSVRIDARQRQIAVSVDGEILHLEAPLHYRIRPGALRVMAPDGSE